MEVGVCSSGGFLIGWLVEHSANENVSEIIVFSCAAGDGDFKGCVSLTVESFACFVFPFASIIIPFLFSSGVLLPQLLKEMNPWEMRSWKWILELTQREQKLRTDTNHVRMTRYRVSLLLIFFEEAWILWKYKCSLCVEQFRQNYRSSDQTQISVFEENQHLHKLWSEQMMFGSDLHKLVLEKLCSVICVCVIFIVDVYCSLTVPHLKTQVLHSKSFWL